MPQYDCERDLNRLTDNCKFTPRRDGTINGIDSGSQHYCKKTCEFKRASMSSFHAVGYYLLGCMFFRGFFNTTNGKYSVKT
jgi:hypothetical protein